MQNKIQELTDRLYQEGLSKGKAEGEALLEKAKADAAEIVAKAEAQAADIRAKAVKDAEELKSKVESDLKMASSQMLQATKKEIENLILRKISGEKISETISDTGFLKEIIRITAEKFSAQESQDLAIILPESLKSQMETYVSQELREALGQNIEASFSKRISGGFRIGPKDGSYFISFTDDTFKALISEYLRPVTKKFLFLE